MVNLELLLVGSPQAPMVNLELYLWVTTGTHGELRASTCGVTTGTYGELNAPLTMWTEQTEKHMSQ